MSSDASRAPTRGGAIGEGGGSGWEGPSSGGAGGGEGGGEYVGESGRLSGVTVAEVSGVTQPTKAASYKDCNWAAGLVAELLLAPALLLLPMLPAAVW